MRACLCGGGYNIRLEEGAVPNLTGQGSALHSTVRTASRELTVSKDPSRGSCSCPKAGVVLPPPPRTSMRLNCTVEVPSASSITSPSPFASSWPPSSALSSSFTAPPPTTTAGRVYDASASCPPELTFPWLLPDASAAPRDRCGKCGDHCNRSCTGKHSHKHLYHFGVFF